MDWSVLRIRTKPFLLRPELVYTNHTAVSAICSVMIDCHSSGVLNLGLNFELLAALLLCYREWHLQLVIAMMTNISSVMAL